MILVNSRMQRETKYCLWLVVALQCCLVVAAQDPDKAKDSISNNDSAEFYQVPAGESPFIVRNIIIEGNKKTRPDIILREMSFKKGDRYLLQDLVKKFEISRRQLLNTSLFHEVIVALKSFDGYNVDVLVQVRERLYIFPVPYFKPVDRNLNQWLFEQNASLARVNYGVKLLYNNATGRNDKVKLWLITGYTRQLAFSYDRPYFDKKMKWGVATSISAGKNREINYNTIADKQVFLKNDLYVRNFFNAAVELTYRPAIKTRHRFGIAYTMEEVADTVVKLNPFYFPASRKSITFPELNYTMTYYDLDYIPYPTKGYAAEVTVSKRGIDKAMNSWQVMVKASGNWPVNKKTFVSLNAYGTIKVPFSQPYYNRKLLGYSDVFLQGYEYYVVDGVAGGYLKGALTRRLLNFSFNTPSTGKRGPLRVPINIYGRIFGNAGYVYNKFPADNYLSNKMLFSSGFGIDITTIYDFNIKIDWSFNQLGQNGIFLHRRSIF